ncbi:hypothetical protein RJ55_08055 [Drechmeria coniospora]|nr:hypothetical protein RJ55_08055 [Drechmeria coniospora]
MTDNPAKLPPQIVVPSQPAALAAPATPVIKGEVAANAAETADEEPYTIKCICNFTDDDGNTIYCETCDSWQHIECFYPNNRDEAIREDFAHSCADCKPRPLDRQAALERAQMLRNAVVKEQAGGKKHKRPPKSHKKKAKPADVLTNGTNGHSGPSENGKRVGPGEQPPPSKKSKTSHRPSHSIGSLPSKRSPSYGNSRSNLAHPPSPATTPPDLPDDFMIHHYSDGFYSLYNESPVPDSHNNAFASIAIPAALGRWLRDPATMKKEVGRTRAEVFHEHPRTPAEAIPRLEVEDSTRTSAAGATLRWRFVKSTAPVKKDVPLIELNGEIGFQKDYCANPDNLWADLSSPLPFVFFHPILPLYIDTRKEGSLARYIRRSCKPNAQLDTHLSAGSDYHFWLVSDRFISENEQITLPWDFRLEKSVHSRWLNLLGLSEDDAALRHEPEMDESEYNAIKNWIDRILSEYGGCACDLENNCAFARFHRRYIFGKNQGRPAKKKARKSRNHTISPTSTGQATNSPAASDGRVDDNADSDIKHEPTASRSNLLARDRGPFPLGQFDKLGILTEPTDRDKRKVAMVEDSFRRMEQAQPPRKKKRVSDGTTASTSSKPKPRTGSTGPPATGADGSVPRSKSGSPAAGAQSNGAAHPGKPGAPRKFSSALARPTYCDVSIQTDPVEGEWFSGACKSRGSKKRVISLSKRLLNSRLKNHVEEKEVQKEVQMEGPSEKPKEEPTEEPEDERKDMSDDVPSERPKEEPREAQNLQSLPLPNAADASAHVDLPTREREPSTLSCPAGAGPSLSHAGEDQPHTGAPAAATSTTRSGTGSRGAMKTPDLGIQIPPVPAFDNSALATTPLPVTSTSATVQSPSCSTLASTLPSPVVSSLAISPSPAKKKLSLSDYTKSRMNKSVGKAASGLGLVKPGLASLDDNGVDVSMALAKAEDLVSPPVPAATNDA